MTRRGRPRDPSIDRAVIDACVELLAEVGRAGLSRQKIAQRAGVSAPAVNRRFASVDDILLAIAATPYHNPHSMPAAPTLRAELIQLLARTAQTMRNRPIRRSAAELLAVAAGDDRIDAAFQSSLRSLRAETLDRIEAARRRGEVGADVDADVLVDLLNGLAYYRLLWRGAAIGEEEVESLVDLILNGATPR